VRPSAVQDIAPIWVTRVGVAADTVLCQLVTEMLRPRIQPAGSGGTVPVSWPSLVRRTYAVISSRPVWVIPMLTMVT
jgi:hypothetical protein